MISKFLSLSIDYLALCAVICVGHEGSPSARIQLRCFHSEVVFEMHHSYPLTARQPFAGYVYLGRARTKVTSWIEKKSEAEHYVTFRNIHMTSDLKRSC